MSSVSRRYGKRLDTEQTENPENRETIGRESSEKPARNSPRFAAEKPRLRPFFARITRLIPQVRGNLFGSLLYYCENFAEAWNFYRASSEYGRVRRLKSFRLCVERICGRMVDGLHSVCVILNHKQAVLMPRRVLCVC